MMLTRKTFSAYVLLICNHNFFCIGKSISRTHISLLSSLYPEESTLRHDQAIPDSVIAPGPQHNYPRKEHFQIENGPNKLYARLGLLLLDYLPKEVMAPAGVASDSMEPLQHMIRTGSPKAAHNPVYNQETQGLNKLISEAWKCLKKSQLHSKNPFEDMLSSTGASSSLKEETSVLDRLTILLDAYVKLTRLGHDPSHDEDGEIHANDREKDNCLGIRQILKDMKKSLRRGRTRKSSHNQSDSRNNEGLMNPPEEETLNAVKLLSHQHDGVPMMVDTEGSKWHGIQDFNIKGETYTNRQQKTTRCKRSKLTKRNVGQTGSFGAFRPLVNHKFKSLSKAYPFQGFGTGLVGMESEAIQLADNSVQRLDQPSLQMSHSKARGSTASTFPSQGHKVSEYDWSRRTVDVRDPRSSPVSRSPIEHPTDERNPELWKDIEHYSNDNVRYEQDDERDAVDYESDSWGDLLNGDDHEDWGDIPLLQNENTRGKLEDVTIEGKHSVEGGRHFWPRHSDGLNGNWESTDNTDQLWNDELPPTDNGFYVDQNVWPGAVDGGADDKPSQYGYFGEFLTDQEKAFDNFGTPIEIVDTDCVDDDNDEWHSAPIPISELGATETEGEEDVFVPFDDGNDVIQWDSFGSWDSEK